MNSMIPHFGIIILTFLASITIGSEHNNADATFVAIIVGLIVMLVYTGLIGILTITASSILFIGLKRL